MRTAILAAAAATGLTGVAPSAQVARIKVGDHPQRMRNGVIRRSYLR